MSAHAPLLTRSWTVGHYEVTLTVQPPRRGRVAHAHVEWSPSVPTVLTAAEWHEYRTGRDAAFAELGLLTHPID